MKRILDPGLTWRPARLLAADLFEDTERDGDWAAAAAEDFKGDLTAGLFTSALPSRPGMPAMSDLAMAPTVTRPAVRPSLAAAAFFPSPPSGSSKVVVRSTVAPNDLPDGPALPPPLPPLRRGPAAASSLPVRGRFGGDATISTSSSPSVGTPGAAAEAVRFFFFFSALEVEVKPNFVKSTTWRL